MAYLFIFALLELKRILKTKGGQRPPINEKTMKYILIPLFRTSFVLVFLLSFGMIFIFMSLVMFLWNFDFSFSKEELRQFVWDSNRRYVKQGDEYWVNESIIDYIFNKRKYYIME